MRCFVAVSVGPRITKTMASAVTELRAEAERSSLDVAWTRPEGWHITLKFMGEIAAEQRGEIGVAVHSALAGQPPLPVAARGLVALPRAASPRVLAVVCHDDGRLGELAAGLDAALEPLGCERERRRFVAHLTVARIRDRRASLRRGHWKGLGALVAAMADRELGRGEITSVGLYRSELGDGPARYELLERFELDAAPPPSTRAGGGA